MKYVKLKVSYKSEYADRFNRVVLVKETLNLDELGVALVAALGGALEHNFLFIDGEKRYEPLAFVAETRRYFEFTGRYHISDLSDSFEFDYDTGDCWDFDATKLEKDIELDIPEGKAAPIIVILEGVGLGIWEDNRRSLDAYLSGEIDGDFDLIDGTSSPYALPWNHNIKSAKEFDLPLNLEKINKTLNTALRRRNREYKQGNRDVANSYGLSRFDLYYYDYSTYIKEYIDKYIRPILDGLQEVLNRAPFDERFRKLFDEAYFGRPLENNFINKLFQVYHDDNTK